ncbi:class I SAM-dependent methyltransferase [Flavivirga amylovorans]|uniref:Class I SAM-dependent methyltransferase n=1 Tax=Flavivirga amylovorans TaxID=870486 RepID=A0ABT8X279_9FLAO|nr:class I SAM-dependent methyltransferase [Flavivirga amylovorans]MDO5988053.1 class I SAM-dependent methyltransferase [Flavivirga amylovorans]
MNTSILNTEIQAFITTHLNSDITSLLLKGTSFPQVKTNDIIEQIEAKKRCEKKLLTWFKCNNIYYPNKLNIEQTSSEITAQYKAGLIDGESIIDLTGGFGIDCYYFSNVFKTVMHCEINKSLSDIVTHNYKQLGVDTIETKNVDGISYLKTSNKQFNWVYIDPSRRHDSKGKVFFLNDCLPNVPEHIDLLFNHTKNIMIKTSPLLDLSIGINELKHVKTIHIVAVNNEVKELLWVLENGFEGAININTVNIKKEAKESFNFSIKTEKASESKYSQPLTYLYEPNSAILKAGAFHTISNQLNVYKLHKHSHLYTSNSLIDFPGRAFKIESIMAYNKKALRKHGISKANITTRNFPETVQQIRKKFNIKDGGNIYLFFTTDKDDNRIVIVSYKTD